MSAPLHTRSDVLPLANAEMLARRRIPTWPRFVIGLGAVSYVIMLVVGVATASFEVLEAVPLIPVLGYVAYRLGRKVADSERDPTMVHFVLAAFAAKMMGTLLRAVVVAVLYDNRSDSLDYHAWGKYFAPQFRGLDFSEIRSFSGTDFMRALTGAVYSVTGASKVSGAIFISFLSFVGLLLLWRAFRRAVPDGAGYRYGLLVLFLPSLLYWPSALGKEGWAIFGLGVASYGLARILTGSVSSGLLLFLLGLVGVTMLRPHVALTMFCGVVLAAAIGKSRSPSAKTSLVRLVVFGALLVVGVMLASSTSSFFGVTRLDQETANEILNEAEGRTDEAGSKFSPVSMSNPANAPMAVVTVLFRPLPFEVNNAVAGASALEGLFLFGLGCASWRRLRSIPRCMREQPYVAYCVGITFTFIYAFSAFSNFGILARQRAQVMPFFLVLLCLPVWTRRGVISTDEAVEGRDERPDDPYADIAAPPVYAAPEVVDPYAEVDVDAPPGPYEESVADLDPYARFTAPDRDLRHGDG